MAETPKILGKYRIVRELGRGSFGVVYLAEDTTLHDRPVALKVLYPQLLVDPETVGLFRQEAGTTARLDQPHIVTVYEAGDAEGVRFIAMRYVPGRTLAQVIHDEGPQPLARVAGWLAQIASALDYAHGQGVLHRDVKPGNILLDRDGRAVVTDFGLAKAVSASGGSISSQDRAIMTGTAKYMAPEQARGQPLPQSDLYSLGVVLYELLTGQVPFDGEDPFAIAIRHMTEAPRPPRELRPDLPEAVESVVLRALAKEPAERWDSAREMARAFRLAVEEGKGQEARSKREIGVEAVAGERAEIPAQAATPQTPASRRPAWVWVVVAAVLLAAGVGLGLALGGGEQGTPPPAIPTTAVALAPPTTAVAPSETPVPATDIPTPTPTSTPSPTPTPTPMLTDAPPPTSTPTPKIPQAGDTQTRSQDGMAMVYVPAGEFLMGSTDADPDAYDYERPQHTVTLDAFWIDRTEVTNAQYRQCVRAGACTAPSSSGSYTRDSYYGDSGFDDYPVIFVNWDQANAYCAWAGARLPTEAEWEKAARGTDGRTYPWGNEWDVRTVQRCNFSDKNDPTGPSDTVADDGYADTAPVGSYPAGASPYGALDLAGNVWEWVNDWYDGGYYGRSPAANPPGPDSGSGRVLRGGSWSGDPGVVRAAGRGGGGPSGAGSGVGFRCARSGSEP